MINSMTSTHNQADVHTHAEAEGNSGTYEHADPVFLKGFASRLPSRYGYRRVKHLAVGHKRGSVTWSEISGFTTVQVSSGPDHNKDNRTVD